MNAKFNKKYRNEYHFRCNERHCNISIVENGFLSIYLHGFINYY